MNKNLGPIGDPEGHKGISIPHPQKKLESFFNINISDLPKNKEIVIELKLDENGNLIFFSLDSTKKENELKVEEVKKEKTIEDRIAEFDKEVNERRLSGNFTHYEIECFIERNHHLHNMRTTYGK